MSKRQLLSTAAIELLVRTMVLTAVVTGGTRVASAQSTEAEALFREGERLMATSNLPEACIAFEGSNRIEPRAGTLIRLGECREKNQQLASAWSAYSDALTRAKDPTKRIIAERAVKVLEPRLSRLTIKVGTPVSGLQISRNQKVVDAVLWNRAIPIDGGDHTIVVTAPGFTSVTIVTGVPVERGAAVIEVPTLAPVDRVPDPSRAPPAQPTRQVAEPVIVKPTSPVSSRKWPSLSVGAGAVVLLGGGLAFELWGRSTYAEGKGEGPSSRRDHLYDSANNKRLAAQAFAAGGVLAGGLALWLYLRQPDEKATARASRVNVGVSATGIIAWGRF